MKKGISRDNIRVIGDISLDDLYLKLQTINKKKFKQDQVLSILFVTSQMVEHGYWLPWMRERVVTEVVTSIKMNFPDTRLLIKIHPIREKMEDYRIIINKIDPTIRISQDSDLTQLIEDADLVIGFGITSAYFQALFLEKPVLLMNLFNEDVSQNVYCREKLITECKTSDELVNHIRNSTYVIPEKGKFEQLINRLFYRFDGKCSERAVDLILSHLQNKNNMTL
jgi:hypothetical protein